jgi:translation initiation factor IF-2
MSEKEMVKVYELAKELGMDSISLLDRLNSLNIKVKNHMSELRIEEAQTVRAALRASKGDIKPTKKTTTRAKKKITTPTETEKKASVIRRRQKEDSALTMAELPEEKEVKAHPEEILTESEHLEQAPSAQEPEVLVTEVKTASLTATSEEAGSEKQVPLPPKPARPPIVLTPRPVAPRRSILKIVEATPPPQKPMIKPAAQVISPVSQKPTVKGVTTQDKDGFRIIKMTKENLDQMVEEEAAKKRGGGRETELRPEDVRFADYRKKELVFLPKKKKIPIGKEIKKTEKTVAKAQKRVVTMHESISVQDLANQLSTKVNDIIRKLMGLGQMANIHQVLDVDTATLIANEYEYEVRSLAFDEDVFLEKTEDAPENLKHRPPIVTIMGHVDHGKTTLLDAIRHAHVASGEAGGITQHIGAYTVEKEGKQITFIDTPGHEAFTVMRARGANVTDIVVLVVSADDGVMPQTREAVAHAQAAKVPILVAINKIDKPGANVERIKQALSELDLLAEDWGGQTAYVEVSALKHTNLDKLLDAILLQAEMLELKANAQARASGTVLEVRLLKGRGIVVSVLVSRGTLHVGDAIVSGQCVGKVKALTSDQGENLACALPAMPVEILGFEHLPQAGDPFSVTATEADARRIVENRIDKHRAQNLGSSGKMNLEGLFSKIQLGQIKELNVIVKADAFGSVEAIKDSLMKLSTEKVKVKPILCAAGGITESDVLLASASGAIIIGFQVRPETKARQLAEAEQVPIQCYQIIYELLDDVKKSMQGLLEKKKVEKFLGRAEIRQIFTVPKIGTIGGSCVIDGKIIRGSNVRLLRDSRIIFEGKMSSLRRFKDDAKEVSSGFECGIGIENYHDLKIGDLVEAYQVDYVTPDLN